MELDSSHSSLSSVRKAEAEAEAEMPFAGRSGQVVVTRVNKKKEYGNGDETTAISSSASTSSSINLVKNNNEDGNCYESISSPSIDMNKTAKVVPISRGDRDIPIDINYSITMAASILKNIRAASSTHSSSSSSDNMILRRKRRRYDDVNVHNKAATETRGENDGDHQTSLLLERSSEKKIRQNYVVGKKDCSKVSTNNNNNNKSTDSCFINEGTGKGTRSMNNNSDNCTTETSVVDVAIEKNDNDDDDVIVTTKETTTVQRTTIRPLRYSALQNERWEEMFQRLMVYKNEHTSTDVPKGNLVDPQLGHWVSTQRKLCNKNELSAQRISRLQGIDFIWDSNEAKWKVMYQRLILYKAAHNESTMVPLMYEVEPKLGKWVKQQRMFYKKKELSKDRVNRLITIGFVWDPQDVKWKEMFHKLMDYKKQHNQSMVHIPARYKLDVPLGKWAHRQRTDYRKKTLSIERVTQLESIGFYLGTKK